MIIQIIFIVVFFPAVILAQSQTPCPSLETSEDIIACALLRHPELKVSEAGLNQSVKLEQFARQVPNPEFDMRNTYGKSLGDNIIGLEMNLAFVIQLGGKRRARIQQAWAAQAEAAGALLRTKEDVYISTLSSLIRLGQLGLEIDAIDHALSAFAHILSLYRSYGQLSSEQQISQDIFQIAHGDYVAKKTTSILEQQQYVRNLSYILGEKIVLKPMMYPKPSSAWPKLMLDENLNGSGIKLAEAELQRARAELRGAESDSWPDVRIGPSLEQQTEGPFTYQSYGFNLSLPIPVFNVNQGGRAYARAGVMKAEANLASERAKLTAAKEVFIQQYNAVIDGLRAMPELSSVEGKHKKAESFFRRGLLSTSLLVEYHRQIVDFIEDRNLLELSAVENLWRVYALEGRIFQNPNLPKDIK